MTGSNPSGVPANPQSDLAIYRTIWQEKGAFKEDFFDHTFAEASTLAGQADEECLKSCKQRADRVHQDKVAHTNALDGDQVATPHSQGSRPEHGRFRHSTPSEEAPQRGPKRHRRKPLTAEQLDVRPLSPSSYCCGFHPLS